MTVRELGRRVGVVLTTLAYVAIMLAATLFAMRAFGFPMGELEPFVTIYGALFGLAMQLIGCLIAAAWALGYLELNWKGEGRK